MSNSGIRMQDLILPLIAGGASAFSRPAARGIAVGLGALGGVMQQRQEQQRAQAEMARAQQQQQAKLDAGKRLGAFIQTSMNAPKDSAAMLGFQVPDFDPVMLQVAQYQIDQGNPDAAAETVVKARRAPQKPTPTREQMLDYIKFARENPGLKLNLGDAGSYEAPKPEQADTEWRPGARFGTEELFNSKTGEAMGKVRPVGQKPPEPKDKPEMIDGLSPERLKIVESITDKFNSHPTVEGALISGEGITYANSFDINSKSSADDISLIYAYAKVNDPPSVVRESEADLIRSNAQSLASTYGFNAQRLLAGTQLLTPQARANMIKAMNAKHAARDKQYQNTRSEFSKRIARYVGPEKADSFLPNYSAGMTMPKSEPAQGGGAPAPMSQEAQDFLNKKRK